MLRRLGAAIGRRNLNGGIQQKHAINVCNKMIRRHKGFNFFEDMCKRLVHVTADHSFRFELV